ncbi:hypothetical protein D3C74_313540 [compost metagenome]
MLTPTSTTAERAVMEMLFRGREQELAALYPRLLILLDDHWIGLEEGFAAVKELRSCNYRTTLWVSEQLVYRIGAGEVAKKTGVDSIISIGRTSFDLVEQEYEVIFVPVLNFSMLSKLSRLDDSHPFSRAVIQALCSGKKVEALTLGIDSQLPEWRTQGLTQAPAMRQQLQGMLRDIQSYGVNTLRPDQLSRLTVKKEPLQTLITAEDITMAYNRGKRELKPQGRVVITPLAKDLSAHYGIIIYESGL